MKRIALIFILLLSFIHCYSQEDLYDKIENALIELHFNNNIENVKQIYPSLEKECKGENNDTTLCSFQSLHGALLFVDEKYDKALPILEKEIMWKEDNGLTRYHYLEDVFMLSQCYLINDNVDEAEKVLRRAVVNWTDESSFTMLSASSGTIGDYSQEYKDIFFLAGYYITDIFQTLAQIYIQKEEYTIVPYCYYEAQKNAAMLFSENDDRYYENLLLLIRSNIELERYTSARTYLIDYHDIPEGLQSREEMKKLQEELQKYIDL